MFIKKHKAKLANGHELPQYIDEIRVTGDVS